MQNKWHEHSVGNIVVNFPLSSAIFRAAGIDYCCGGGRLLGEVIKEQRLIAGRACRTHGKARRTFFRNERGTACGIHPDEAPQLPVGGPSGSARTDCECVEGSRKPPSRAV